MITRILSFLFTVSLVFAAVCGERGEAQSQDTYTVRSGDSLWEIAQRYRLELDVIIRANPQFANPDLIYPGDKVRLPLSSIKIASASVEDQVLQMVNQERTNYGLSPLTANWQLARVARFKSEDMRDSRYFDHHSPQYGSPFDMMKNFQIIYTAAGENIAAGQTTAEEVMRGWMDSPGHRENILNPQFTQMGIGYAQGGEMGHYWTQMLIHP